MSTIIAIFFALGIGILIGGTLGQTWMVKTENNIVEILMNRYEGQLTLNQLLQKQMSSLQLMNQTTAPILQNQKIMWIRPQDAHNELLPFVMKSAGVDWIEQNEDASIFDIDQAIQSNQAPDIIILSETSLIPQISDAYISSKLIEIHPKILKFNDPQEALDLILYLKKIMEEESDAAFGIYRYPGME